MAKLKAKVSKTDFEALDASLKGFYVADAAGDYVLDAEGVEDVSGLKNKIAELLKDTKNKGDLLKQFEGLDAEAAKKALEEMASIEEKKLAAKGEYETLLTKHKTEFETKLAEATKSRDTTLANLKREKLTNFLVKNGVIAERAKYALADIESLVDLAEGDNGFELKVKDGTGDAKELDGVISNLKTGSAFLFAASGASGSGASGSDASGSGAGKSMSRAEFDALPPSEQSSFSIGGGQLSD